MLSDEKLREIRESVDLVALISEYVPLRRQGARFTGLCPFHSEKSPSFGVSRGKDFYYCFGCHATGDAISFLRHVEGLGFMEAVEKLAERSGIEVPHTDDVGQQQLRRARARRERLAELMAIAQAYFEEQLYEHPNAEIARDELVKRKVTPESAANFHLGYAPAGWDGLAQYLVRQKASLEEAVELGLIAARNQGASFYDRFRHRLMFPVADQHGRIIAFSGRALAPPEGAAAERDPPAKYINSPESPLYKKGQALFGLSTARVAMRKHNQVLLCEGNFDLVAIHQAGFEQVLAPLGTAFTLEQARLIRRFAEEVVVVFDGDNAGRKATAAAFELLQQAGIKGRAVRLPDGQDPDSFLSSHGVEAFSGMVANAPLILDFLIDEAGLYANDAPSRARAIQRLLPYVGKVADAFERDMYIERLAKKFDIRDLRRLRAEMRKEANPLTRDPGAQRGRDRGRVASAEGPHATVAASPAQPQVRMRATHELPERQRLLLGALLDQPALFANPEAQRLAGLLTDSDLRAIFLDTAQMLEQRGEVDALALLDGLSSNPARAWLVERLEQRPVFSLERAEALLIEGLPWLERDHKSGQRAELKRRIQIATQTNDGAQMVELMRLRDELAKA
jgi:DNA primase